MIRINLLPREERIAAARISLPNLGALAPLSILGVVLLIVGITATLERAKVRALRSDVVELREEVEAIRPQVDRVKRLTEQREELEHRLEIIRQLDHGRFLSVRLMDNMSREVPRYMWLTDLNQEGAASVSLKGITFSNLIVAEFMMRLERSPMFANVDLVRTEKGDIVGRNVMEFAITAVLTPDELPSDFTAEAWLRAVPEEER